ncbi:MAG: hemolysin family protein [Candidatus Zixiibacteriota bacterium]
MRLIYRIVHPILHWLNRLFHYLPEEEGRLQEDAGDTSEGEMESLTDRQRTALEEDEKRMIHGIVELGETEVKEIMLPRPDMVCAEENSTPEEIRELVRRHGHSRIPIYQGNIDRITGIIYVKDLFLRATNQEKVTHLSSLARKACFVPESKKLDELLREFKRDKNHIAIVVDEYGGTAGLVTMEDVLEEIVGEIQDEYDREQPPIQKLDDRTYRVDAKVSIEYLNEILGTQIEEKGFETLGGFIYDLVGGVPEQGKVVEYRSADTELNLLIEKLDGQRIRTIQITIVSSSPLLTDLDHLSSKDTLENE